MTNVNDTRELAKARASTTGLHIIEVLDHMEIVSNEIKKEGTERFRLPYSSDRTVISSQWKR